MANQHSCVSCTHFRKETESWELSHIYWFTCDFRPANENLKNFPFKHGCKAGWEPKANPFLPVLGGVTFGELTIITSGTFKTNKTNKTNVQPTQKKE